MEGDFILNLLNNVTFPVAACIILGAQFKKMLSYHKEEIDRLSSIIDRNTDSINTQKEILLIIKERIE